MKTFDFVRCLIPFRSHQAEERELCLLSHMCAHLTDELLATLKPSEFRDVATVQLQSDAITSLGPIVDFGRQLKALNVLSCDNLTTLAGLERLTGLTWFRLADCGCIADPAPIGALVQLTSLAIARCYYPNDAWDELSFLGNLRRLETVEVIDLDCQALLRGLRGNAKLKKLSSENGTSHFELDGLAADCPAIEELALKTCAGRFSLSPCKTMRALKVLDVRGSTGAYDFSSLVDCTLLERLYLNDTTVTDDGVRELESKLPNCEIFSDQRVRREFEAANPDRSGRVSRQHR